MYLIVAPIVDDFDVYMFEGYFKDIFVSSEELVQDKFDCSNINSNDYKNLNETFINSLEINIKQEIEKTLNILVEVNIIYDEKINEIKNVNVNIKENSSDNNFDISRIKNIILSEISIDENLIFIS